MANHQVRLRGMSFVPDTVSAQAGDTVEWIWESNNHSTTADDGSWDSKVHDQPFTYTHKFDSEGEFPYFCTVHGGPGGAGMSGVIQVGAAGTDSGQGSD